MGNIDLGLFPDRASYGSFRPLPSRGGLRTADDRRQQLERSLHRRLRSDRQQLELRRRRHLQAYADPGPHHRRSGLLLRGRLRRLPERVAGHAERAFHLQQLHRLRVPGGLYPDPLGGREVVRSQTLAAPLTVRILPQAAWQAALAPTCRVGPEPLGACNYLGSNDGTCLASGFSLGQPRALHFLRRGQPAEPRGGMQPGFASSRASTWWSPRPAPICPPGGVISLAPAPSSYCGPGLLCVDNGSGKGTGNCRPSCNNGITPGAAAAAGRAISSIRPASGSARGVSPDPIERFLKLDCREVRTVTPSFWPARV